MRHRIRFSLLALTLLVATPPAGAAGGSQFGDRLKQARQAARGSTATPASASLPTGDIAVGLKEALARSTTAAISRLGRSDGFWGNANVRIPLPGKLAQVGKFARQLGQGARVDAFELSLNRAAEQAVPQVAGIFGDAIRKMTLADARGLLVGGDHAATDYFRRVAGAALSARIEPIVARATDSVGVTRQYKALTSATPGGGLGNALGSLGALGGGHSADAGGSPLNLDDYVTAKTLDGLFTTIGEQEQSIRQNPDARSTALLKKVFGSR